LRLSDEKDSLELWTYSAKGRGEKDITPTLRKGGKRGEETWRSFNWGLFAGHLAKGKKKKGAPRRRMFAAKKKKKKVHKPNCLAANAPGKRGKE